MFIRDPVISDSLHQLTAGMREAGSTRVGEDADKLPVDLSRVIKHHPGKGLGPRISAQSHNELAEGLTAV